MAITIQKDILRIYALGFLEKLLIDRTTGTNILWATDSYAGLGPEYQRDEPIELALITGENAGLIRTRTEKAKDEQFVRAKRYAEICTPSWLCNKMINTADESTILGRPDAFNKDGVPTDKVVFPEGTRRHKTEPWKKYVDFRVLEITCGEAPFLVSRYDAVDGREIEITDRIGLLDRKLRVVSENVGSEEEWLKWATRAFKATYGYELQGDSLLIARINLLVTFEEYLKARWSREPTRQEYLAIIRIITWNIWQMNGLTEKVPYCKVGAPPECRIYDWRTECKLDFSSVGSGNGRGLAARVGRGAPSDLPKSRRSHRRRCGASR